MRERTTWNREVIANQPKNADDPRAMNQDHHSQQPAADAYVTGGPSEFAEDVHPSTGTWKADDGPDGETARNEIGMPQMRGDTYNHPEKTAAADPEIVLKKADLCTKIAQQMLPKDASVQAVEDQALALMNLPDPELIETSNRLAGVSTAAQQQQQDDDDDDEGQQQGGQQQQDKEAKGKVPPQFLEHMKGKKDDDGDDKDDDKGDKEAGDKQALAWANQALQALQSGDHAALQATLQNAVQQQATQQPMEQEALTIAVPPGIANDPMQQQAIEGLSPTVSDLTDDQMLDQMLQQDAPMEAPMQEPQMMMAGGEMDIQMQPSMDIGETPLTQEDAVLTQLFANNREVQMAAHAEEIQTGINPLAQQQPVAAPAAPVAAPAAPVAAPAAPQAPPVTAGRTAPNVQTRVAGTQPTGGVSVLGGGAGGNSGGAANEVGKLTGLWRSAPDVSQVFNP